MSIGPVDMSLAIQSLPQVAAVSKASEEAPRLAAAAAQIEFENAAEERSERVESAERTAHVNALSREGGRDGRDSKKRQTPDDESAEFASDGEAGDDGQHFIDVSV